MRSRVAQRLEGFGATLLTADAESDGAEIHSDLTLTDDPALARPIPCCWRRISTALRSTRRSGSGPILT
ncbi:hypothetical protein O0544_15285 [Edwardsiella anguillarum]|nr:hypothetical protein [Edwardsiella anguillarum]